MNNPEFTTVTDLRAPDKKGFAGFLSAHARLVEFALTFIFFFGRTVCYGTDYFFRASEIVTYHNYPVYYATQSTSLVAYVRTTGLLSVRPVAGILDVFVWARFFGSMIVAVALLALMFAASAVMLRYVFEKLFGTGYLFSVIFCLTPLSLDGLYFVGYSTRLIPAIFFASMGVLFAYKFKESSRIRFAPAFMVTHMISFLFHECVAFTAMALMLYIILRRRDKNSITALLVVANVFMYAVLSLIAGLVWQTVSPAGAAIEAGGSVIHGAASTLSAVTAYSPVTLFGEFVRGAGAIFSGRAAIYAVAMIAAVVVTVILILRRGLPSPPRRRALHSGLLGGVVLAVIPFVSTFLLTGAETTAADLIPALCGIALAADSLVRVASRGRRVIYTPVLAIVLLVFCVASVSKMQDYRESYLFEQKTAREVVELVSDQVSDGKIAQNSKVAILNVPDGSPEVYEALTGNSVSAMSDRVLFTGLLRAVSDDPEFPTVTPIPVDEDSYFYRDVSGADLRIENYDRLYVEKDGEYVPVTYARGFTEDEYDPHANYDSYLLYTDDFIRLAHVNEYSTYGIFEFY